MSERVPLALIPCPDYEPDNVRKALQELMKPLGGWSRFIRPGMTVLLKPNMLSCRTPEAAATTHPEVLKAVAEACLQHGARVWIGDSPPIAGGRLPQYWKETGFQRVAEETGAALLPFEKEPTTPLALACTSERKPRFQSVAPRLIPPVGTGEGKPVHVTSRFYQADLLINLPKMKTHNLTVITGAVKNLFGLLPGVQKPFLHARFPHPDTFAKMIVELARELTPGLSIMDGISAMDRQGPAAGRVIHPGLLLASTHPVAVDLAFCHLAGLDPSTIPTLRWSTRLNFGPADLNQTTMSAEDLDRFAIQGFQAPPPSFMDRIPLAAFNIGRRLVRAHPILVPDRCISCGQCKRLCPVKAIALPHGEPVFHRRRCISCFCCTEICPVNALEIRTSTLVSWALLLKKFRRKLKEAFRT